MRRMVMLLILLGFGLTSSFLSPLALCQHADRAAHETALRSDDPRTASHANREEAAAAALEKLKSSLDPLGGGIASAIFPRTPELPAPFDAGREEWQAAAAREPDSRSVSPLLHPPAPLAA